MNTLVGGDKLYISEYLKEADTIAATTIYTDLTGAQTITYRMRMYGASTNAVSTTCEVVTATLGYIRAFVTVPTARGVYETEAEVIFTNETITWKCQTYYIQSQLG